MRAILAHEVKVDDSYATSPALPVREGASVIVKERKRFVSRGGYKLQEAIDLFCQDVKGTRCLDVGSSTGGFTDCLLQAGAAHVVCVDVNYGQLAWSLRQDNRVKIFERTNIKNADPREIGSPFDVIVADLSFIGLARLAPVFKTFSRHKTVFIGLIKPQFESDKGESEGGIVQDAAVHERVIEEVKQALDEAGFCCTGVIDSPITGAQGNKEYLIRAVFERVR